MVPYTMIKSLMTNMLALAGVQINYPEMDSVLSIFGASGSKDRRLREEIQKVFLGNRTYPPHPSHAIFKTLKNWSKACNVTYLLRNDVIKSHLQVYYCAAYTLRHALVQTHKAFCDQELQVLPSLYTLLADDYPRLTHPGLTAGAVYARLHKDYAGRLAAQFKRVKADLFALSHLFLGVVPLLIASL